MRVLGLIGPLVLCHRRSAGSLDGLRRLRGVESNVVVLIHAGR